MPANAPDPLRRAWLLVGGLLVSYVLWQSLVPQPFTEGIGGDKFQHLGTYALLGWWFGCMADGAGVGRRLVPALVLVAMGTAIEGMQSFMPPREPSSLDALANAVGVALGSAIAAVPGLGGLAILRRLLGASKRC